MDEPRHHFLRNADAGALAEIFLVTAAVTIVGTRVFLLLSGYPQIGGEKYHIAHMLWGGLLLVVALLLLLFLLNRRMKYVAAFIGGMGFGLFIDELGKFITADNNYFFRPTYAFIYLIFILLYFVIRKAITARELSATEHTANSLELLKEIVANDFSPQERERLVNYLKSAEREGRDVALLRKYLQSAKVTGSAERSLYAAGKSALLRRYRSIVAKRWFQQSIWYVFLGQVVLYSLNLLDYVFTVDSFGIRSLDLQQLTFFDLGIIFSYSIAIVLLVIGLSQFWHPVRGLRWFERATLVSIFLVGFFNFYHNQLSALVAVVFHVIVLYALHVIIGLRTSKN